MMTTGAFTKGETQLPWKTIVDEPLNRYVRYPLAKRLVSYLVHTPITPNQLTAVQPVLAALAAYCIAQPGYNSLLMGALCFELRSVLDCADGSLARAKNMCTPAGHAIDGIADWVSTVCLYVGIYLRLRHEAPIEAFGMHLSVGSVILLVLAQAAFRSFASDYYLHRYGAIFDTGRDVSSLALRKKILALNGQSGFFEKAEVFIGRFGHFFFQHEWLSKEKAALPTDDREHPLVHERNSPATKFIAFLWSISNGDAFLTFVILSAVFNQLLFVQYFFATFGIVWIIALVIANTMFIQRAERRSSIGAPEQ